MQKDDRSYAFLLKKTSRSQIYIRRIEISKNKLHTGIAGLFITLGLLTAGLTSVTKFQGFELTASIQSQPETTANIALQNFPKAELKTISYQRPGSVGGPVVSSFRLTNIESESEENALESRIRSIEALGNSSSLPLIWAHMGKINNEFGFRRNPFGGRNYEFHAGIDIAGEKGDIVVAPGNGTVLRAGWQGGYGNFIEIDHGNGLTTRYGHLSRIEIQAGDTVQRGQVIGMVGSTGRSTGPHLHFEVRIDDKAINPRRFLPPELPK